MRRGSIISEFPTFSFDLGGGVSSLSQVWYMFLVKTYGLERR